MSHAGTEDKFLKTLFPENMQNKSILDIGCGYGATAHYIRTRTYKNGWPVIIGVEPFKEYVDLQLKMGIYDDVLHGRGEKLPFPNDSFNIAIAQHVIEHLDKPSGYVMLEEMSRVAADRVIICTPNGYTESGPLDGNEHNNHLSGWTQREFTDMGYNTKVVTKNVNSRLLTGFAKLVFTVQRKRWDNEVLVAWKDVHLDKRIEACGCGQPV